MFRPLQQSVLSLIFSARVYFWMKLWLVKHRSWCWTVSEVDLSQQTTPQALLHLVSAEVKDVFFGRVSVLLIYFFLLILTKVETLFIQYFLHVSINLCLTNLAIACATTSKILKNYFTQIINCYAWLRATYKKWLVKTFCYLRRVFTSTNHLL